MKASQNLASVKEDSNCNKNEQWLIYRAIAYARHRMKSELTLPSQLTWHKPGVPLHE